MPRKKSTPEYKPVPTGVAAAIGAKLDKSQVLIFAWDPVHKKLHSTSWGQEQGDKEQAAEGAEYIAGLLTNMREAKHFEDFRGLEVVRVNARIASKSIHRPHGELDIHKFTALATIFAVELMFEGSFSNETLPVSFIVTPELWNQLSGNEELELIVRRKNSGAHPGRCAKGATPSNGG